MLPAYRSIFNTTQFTPARYAELLAELNRRTRTDIQFQISETPCFFPRALLDDMCDAGRTLTHQLIDSPEYMQLSDAAIPEQYKIPNDNPRPNFMTVDFGLIRNAAGALEPKLVELQAFPSIFGYQDVLCEEYQRLYDLDPALEWRFSGLSSVAYWDLLRRTIVGDHAPENVVLAEIDPASQKTLPDFHVYEDRLGIRTVDITQLTKRGRKLFYERDGVETPVHRIYNRAIVDELERKHITPAWDYREELDVEWAGHPNWYFRISKFRSPTSNTRPFRAASSWTTGSRARATASPTTAPSSSSSRSTPSPARASSSPPPTPTSPPSPRRTATTISSRSACTLSR